MQILAGVRLVALRSLGEGPVNACEACSAENHCCWRSPNARHDDQVDSVSQFLQWVAEHLKNFNIPLVGAISESIPRLSWWGTSQYRC